MKSANLAVHLALPSFLQSEECLFAKASVQNIPKYIKKVNGFLADNMLLDLIMVNQDSPPAFAAITAQSYNINSMDGWWLRLDPIELFVDGGNIGLIGNDHLSLQEEESSELLLSLNTFLAQDGFKLIFGSPREWFLQLPHDPEIVTCPLKETVGKDIRNFLPAGKKQIKWRKLLTELQMILFEHPINDKRVRESQPPVNSVWLWGEGSITKPYILKNYTNVWSDCSLVKGAAKLFARKKVQEIKEFSVSNLNAPGDYLIATDENYALVGELLTSFNHNLVDELIIYNGNGESYHFSSKKRLFSWLSFSKG